MSKNSLPHHPATSQQAIAPRRDADAGRVEEG